MRQSVSACCSCRGIASLPCTLFFPAPAWPVLGSTGTPSHETWCGSLPMRFTGAWTRVSRDRTLGTPSLFGAGPNSAAEIWNFTPVGRHAGGAQKARSGGLRRKKKNRNLTASALLETASTLLNIEQSYDLFSCLENQDMEEKSITIYTPL